LRVTDGKNNAPTLTPPLAAITTLSEEIFVLFTSFPVVQAPIPNKQLAFLKIFYHR